MDSLFPFLQGLAPLQHVGLSRRTVYHRLSGSYRMDKGRDPAVAALNTLDPNPDSV